MTLVAPMPYLGGKSRIASLVWARLGDVPNYVEPFAGSAAVLLARPDTHCWWERTETVNDADGMVANLWRSLQADPEAVAHWADWPINETDLHAKHAWLVARRAELTARLEGDPAYYDAKIAGWWLWGICVWIGSGWCSGQGPWQVVDGKLVHLGDDGQGIHRKRVHLGNDGRGINRQLVHLNNGVGQCAAWSEHLRVMMTRFADRLRRVRVCSGDWSRVCGPTPTVKLGMTGVFLDPPYSDAAGRQADLYAVDSESVAHAVRAWAIEQGENPSMRVAMCGYEGEHDMPETWSVVRWKAHGGYGTQGHGRGRQNAKRECIWFSPACLPAEQADLFTAAGIEVAG